MDVRFQRNIPVRFDVDVFVAGGGPAGVAAAVMAGRQGSRVFLAEAHTCLGGMGTAGLVPVFMMFDDGVNFLAGGIGREIHDKLFQMGGAGPDENPVNHRIDDFGMRHVAIRSEVLKRLYDELVTESGVDFSFQTQVIGVETEGDRVSLAICSAKSGLFAIKAKMFIDATGDGDLAVWAGAPFEKGDENGNLMGATLCSLWADVDWEKVRASELHPDNCRLEEAFRDKVFSVPDRHLSGMWRTGEHLAGGNIGHVFGVDGTDERSLTKALVETRRRLLEYERYYKEYLKGFEKMELISTGSLMGLRESRRIVGDYVLNVGDFERRAVFDDEIGRFAYPVDVHPSSSDGESYEGFEENFHMRFRYAPGESYGIPYRVLTPKNVSNLLVAGRCISTDRYMQGSVRVMPGCFITGQAAGVAAALAIKDNTDTSGLPIVKLQQRLKDIGAFLPN